MTSGNKTSSENKLLQEEFFDAVRRHICQVLGFDYGLIDLVRGHEVINFTHFSANDAEEDNFLDAIEDDQQQPLLVAHTMVAQKVKQTQKPWVGKAFEKGSTEGFP